MFRSVSLPTALPGHLFLHSMPGRHEPMAAFDVALTAHAVDRIISLTGLAEIRAKSPAFAQAIDAGLGWPRTEFAIEDFGVPADPAGFFALAQEMAADLRRGKSLLVHCGAGIGRTGTLAASALLCLGMDEAAALQAIHQAGAGPETPAQSELVRWVAAQTPTQGDPMTHNMIPSRPHMPGYGIQDAEDGAGLLPWSHVDERMAPARNYWISTTRPDGRPHAAPVWGVWIDGALYFGVGSASRKGRNIVHQPWIVAHLESGDDTVILEGTVERVAERAMLEAINAVYGPKYAYYPLGEAGDQPYDEPFYCLRPQVAFAWLESDFPNTATRWVRRG